MKIIFSSIFIFFIFISNIFAQRILTLEDALSIALKESYSIKSADFNLISSEKTLEAVKLGLMTSIDMEVDAPSYSRSLSSQFNTVTGLQQYYQINNTTFESRLFINQPIVFTNGQFSVIGSLMRRDQSFSSQSNRDYFSNLSLRLRQPLFTFNTLSANLERAELNLQKTKKNYTKSQADIVYNVTAAFYDLYQKKKNLEITQEKVNQVQVSFETSMNKFKAGLIAEVEALQLEVDLASSKDDLLSSQRRFDEAKNNFKLLIGLSLDENIDVVASIEFKLVDVDENTAIQAALKNRPELFNSETDIKLNELSVDEVDARKRIKAELNLNYGINKNADDYKNIFKDFLDNRNVIFTVSVPVWDWGKNTREVESAEANLKLSQVSYENQKQSIVNEILQAVNRVQSAKSRVDVLSKTVEVAEKSYNISVERFRAGNITSFDLQQTQQRLTDAKISSLGALIDYNLALADLSRKTLVDFSKSK
ncbi:MAG: TolC family protein [Ignavibacteriales bacterium]|nr:TolC family protein [Ignavibacteriales bacterium]